MAYLREDKKNGESYLRICESVRVGNKVESKTLYSLGKRSDYSSSSLQQIGEKLYALGGGDLGDLQSLLSEEIGRYNYGFPLIINYIYKVYELDIFFRRLKKSLKLSYDLGEVVRLMLCNRLSKPLSKLGLYDVRSDFWGFEEIKLQWLYRSLDKLSIYSDALQSYMYEKNKKLFDYEVDIVFYDVTTFYFDSEVEEAESLRQKGFGKDGKIGKTQILLGLLLDKNRHPLGYELYSGDKYEGHTLRDGVRKMKEKYGLKKVVVVADSGMLNADNLTEVQTADYEFIVGERLKNLSQNIQNELVDRSKYEKMELCIEGENVTLSYRIVRHKGRKILCTYSEKRAKKDRLEREERIAKGKLWAKSPQKLGKKATHYFLKTSRVDCQTGEIREDNATKIIYELDTEKVEKAALFDGLKAIATSDESISNQDILLKYRDLYQIEQIFRVFKSFLETRPMFHWTDQRIKGHFCLCYLAFCCLNYMQQTLQQKSTPFSENNIRKILNQMQFSKVKQDKEIYFLSSKNDKDTLIFLKAFNLKPLQNVANTELITRYLQKV